MRIDKLWISDFKNLQNFEIDFDQDELISVIVGRNGAGKSNVIEALVIIFRDLDLGKDPQFAYRLWYTIHDGQYQIFVDADPQRFREDKRGTKDFYQIKVTSSSKEESIIISNLKEYNGQSLLPRYVFGYYSGPSNRLDQHFQEHQDRFYRDLITQKIDEHVPPLRPLLYARLIHSQFALLAFFLENSESISKFLENQLNIVGLDSVLVILKTPPWANDAKKRQDLFWTARGTVRVFMERLYSLALAPLRLPVSRTEDHLYLYITDRVVLQKLARAYIKAENLAEEETNYQSFFKALESTYISKLIHEVRIKVKIKNLDGSLTFRELSEGEQQLLMVLGLMRFTKEDESLFLLDEPDTHLNPAWSVDYLDFIQGSENIVGLQKNSQVLMTTHNPITLAGLKASQVKIMHRKASNGLVYSADAEQDPIGMGFAGILTSDIFGLQSTLDKETLEKLDQQRRLLIKKDENDLSEKEKADLNRFNQELEEIDATRFVRDPYYALFVKTMKRYEIKTGNLQSRALNPEELAQRDKIAFNILDELFNEAGEE